jgi:type IV fimbrial biogenesis protein FimT
MRARGYTLLELLVAATLAVVLLLLGVPGLRELALDARRTADVNAFVSAIHLARSESLKQARAVVLCHTVDAIACAGSRQPYNVGWMVFVDTNESSTPRRDEHETLLLHYVPVIVGSIRSNRAHYIFQPYYRRSTNGTVVFCDIRGSGAARAVIVSYTGRPRVADVNAAGGPLNCAN